MELIVEKAFHKAASFHAVVNAESINKSNGHENKGFLSFEKGFMPINQPLQNLPLKFYEWDALAKMLPTHYKNQTLRSVIKNLPVLLPTEENLDARYLCRASVLMSIFAHAYVRCERIEDLDIPDSILIPWKIITNRLERPTPFLSYIDLIVYNWKLINAEEDFEVENLELLVPTVNNREENVFYLTQAEILYKASPIVKEIADIQTAILNDDIQGVIGGLQRIQAVVEDITEHSFMKINPNPRSSTYVDPVIWAKTVAPFAVPIKEGVQGPSGTSSPIFHLLDTFLERGKYDTILGKEALFIREWYPENWRNFLVAVEKLSLSGFLKKVNNRELDGAFYSLIESYCGKQGFLGVHKRKVYGYLQLAFKVGRSVTIGGFSGIFKERTWEEVDNELEITRMERYVGKELKCPFATISSRKAVSSSNVQNIELAIGGQGVNYRPGDRCAILPINDAQVVDELINKIALPAATQIPINAKWKEHLNKYYNSDYDSLPLIQILQFGKLNKINFSALKETQLSNNDCLNGIQKMRMDLGLSDFISILFAHNITTEIFKESLFLTNILDIEAERMYSISSTEEGKKDKIELTVGKVPQGVASGFLHNKDIATDLKVPFKIMRPLRFKLPTNLDRPIIMFAGGTGVSPFKSFWEQLKIENKTSLGWLFLSTKDRSSLHYEKELEHLMLHENFSLDITFTKEAIRFNKEQSRLNSKFVFEPGTSARIQQFLNLGNYYTKLYDYLKPKRMGGKEAMVYVCGKAGFAKSVMNSIKDILNKGAAQENQDAKELFLRLFSENRYMQDVFTSKEESMLTPIKYHVSEVVKRNNTKDGYWVIINDRVYDLTEFVEIHPGGVKIVLDNAGRDATHEFNKAEHHLNPEILSFLSMYYIGDCIKPEFDEDIIKQKYDSWLSAMHLCSEMYNCLYSDYGFTNRKTTINDPVKIVTPFKAALVIENHVRFNKEYIPLLLETLAQQYVKEKDIFSELEQVARNFSEASEYLKKMQEPEFISDLDKVSCLLTDLEKRDKKLIQEFRNAFWSGLKCFETYEVELKDMFDHQREVIIEIILDKLNNYFESSFNETLSCI